MPRKIKTLLFSTLFPSSVRPGHGIFVETRLHELLKEDKVETKVVAPVPWFPFSGARFGEYGKFAATPRFEYRNGIEVFHPRYILPPKIGMNIAPYALAQAALPVIRKIIKDGFDFDLIDAHYYYPDGVAAHFIANALKKPFVVTARGTDLNLIPQYAYPRKLIIETAEAAYASIGVSHALTKRLVEIGADPKKLKVFRNGVDLACFHPVNRAKTQKKLGWTGQFTLISVGNLVENKGHHIALNALCQLPNYYLAIIGTGPEENELRRQASSLGLSDRVEFVGHVPQNELKNYYGAADILLLASSREGWPNVLLEAMACGTPVIASRVGGIPEVIKTQEVGLLVDERSADSFAAAVSHLGSTLPDREFVRNYAAQFGWQATTQAQHELFFEIARKYLSKNHSPTSP